MKRLTAEGGSDGGVLHAFVASDGVACVGVSDENAAWIAAIHNAWPGVSERLRKLDQLRRCSPASHLLEEMFARDWSFNDLCKAMQANEVDRLALELLLLVGPCEPDMRLGEMAPKLNHALGVGEGFFENLEREWLNPSGDETEAALRKAVTR